MAIESKVQAAGFWSLAMSTGISLLNAVAGNSALLDPLPPLAQFVILTLIPPALTFLASYQAAHTPRPDLFNYGPALEPHLPDAPMAPEPEPLPLPVPDTYRPPAQPEPPLLAGVNYADEPPLYRDTAFGRGDTTAYGWEQPAPPPQQAPQPMYAPPPPPPQRFTGSPSQAPTQPAPPQSGRHSAPPPPNPPQQRRGSAWADPRAGTAPRPPQP